MEKRCTKCKTMKNISNFGKSKQAKDGYFPICKECRRVYDAEYRKRPGIKESRQKNNAKHAHKYRDKYKNKYQYDRRKYQGTINAGMKEWHKQNPGAYAAHDAVYSAIRNGDLKPITECKCQQCDKPAKHYHHTLGYAPEHRLDVVPLCVTCHRKEHRKKV